jgi:hypothetical protein
MSQNASAWIRGNAVRLAPIISGTRKFPKPPTTAADADPLA